MAKKPVAKVAAPASDDPVVEVKAPEAEAPPVVEVKAPAAVMVQTAGGNPPLSALNARSHDVNAGREIARQKALADAQKAIDEAFAKV